MSTRSIVRIVSILILGSIIMTCAGCFRSASRIVVVEAIPEKGFNYQYILRIPEGKISAKYRFLLVEPNNTGTASDDLDFHLEAAKALSAGAVGSFVSGELRLPLLVPVFPRPRTEWAIYTHLLDRDVMTLRDGPMQRLDLQLIAMVDDAHERLSQEGHLVDRKILITGFSASGAFANRFTMLHPERVFAVANGGVNGLLMLPVESLIGVDLLYPLGLKDYESIAGCSFDLLSWRQVPQFIYMGAEDDNDAVQFDDGYSDSERETVFTVIGKQMQPDRWKKCQDVYRSSGATVTFRTYQGIGHGTNRRINTEIVDFFRATMDSWRETTGGI